MISSAGKLSVYDQIMTRKQAGLKSACLLLDPDKIDPVHLPALLKRAEEAAINFIFLGGSLLVRGNIHDSIRNIRNATKLPVILFPGSPSQFSPEADALLFLSLISGRNADLLIGRHVEAAPFIRQSGVETIPTGYILVDGGRMTTASYISSSAPVPRDKPEIAACTALAGELLGLRLTYLDAGSGALHPVPKALIREVAHTVSTPVCVGGGIRTAEQMLDALSAGADMVVVGNIIEEQPERLHEFKEVLLSFL